MTPRRAATPPLLVLGAAVTTSVLVLVLGTLPSTASGTSITAPQSTVHTYKRRYLVKRTIGPAAWVCVEFTKGQPWEAFDKLEEYLDGENELRKSLSTDTWPQLKIVPQNAKSSFKKGQICHYLEMKYHCDIPKPVDAAIIKKTKRPVVTYYGSKFWGQANDAHVSHRLKKMVRLLKKHKVTDYDDSTLYIGTYPSNRHEVRYNLAGQTAAKA